MGSGTYSNEGTKLSCCSIQDKNLIFATLDIMQITGESHLSTLTLTFDPWGIGDEPSSL